MAEEGKKLITISQAAEEMNIPARTLRYAASRGTLKVEQYGPLRMTTLEWVEEWRKNPQAHRLPPQLRTKP